MIDETTGALEQLARTLLLSVVLPDAPGVTPELRLEIQPHNSDFSVWHVNNFAVRNLGTADAALTRFLGLVEIAATCGYVDLDAWSGPGPDALRRATHGLIERTASVRPDNRQTALVRRLAARLLGRGPVLDLKAFTAFESYLSLTRAVFEDRQLIETLVQIQFDWTPDADTGALAGPSQLAEALATGAVGSVRAVGVPGVPRAARAYEWLADIVERLAEREGLRDDILAHACWSHAAWVARQRLDLWAVRMSEWPQPRDSAGEARWLVFRSRVFARLEDSQTRLGLETSENSNVTYVSPDAFMWTETEVGEVFEVRADELARDAQSDTLEPASTWNANHGGARTGVFGGTMPTEAETRARAMQEFQMTVEICQIRRQAILDARTEALNGVPAGRAALEIYAEAVRAAEVAAADQLEAVQQACHIAEIDAHTKHGNADVAVMDTLQDDNAAAEAAYQAAVEQCEEEYQSAWLAAQQMVGPSADKARREARASRERGLTACDKAKAKALAAADSKYQKALYKNNETMIAETAAAQETMVAAQAAARDKRDRVVRAAAAALGKAINSDAAARAVESDYQARLLRDAQMAEAEKAAVWERMRTELVALGIGGGA